MRSARVVVQILITLVVVAVTMPVVLVVVPGTQSPMIGPPAAIVLAAAVFVVLRLAWPRRAE